MKESKKGGPHHYLSNLFEYEGVGSIPSDVFNFFYIN